jgi:hypothetical protein
VELDKNQFLLACKAEGGAHARRGKENKLVGRLALVRAFWRLLCVVEKGSLVGADKKIYLVVGSAVEDCNDVERACMFVELGCVFKLRWEAWEEISWSTAVCVRMDIELAVAESLQSGLNTGGGWEGERILLDAVVPVGGVWRKVKSSMGVRPS